MKIRNGESVVGGDCLVELFQFSSVFDILAELGKNLDISSNLEDKGVTKVSM